MYPVQHAGKSSQGWGCCSAAVGEGAVQCYYGRQQMLGPRCLAPLGSFHVVPWSLHASMDDRSCNQVWAIVTSLAMSALPQQPHPFGGLLDLGIQ